MAKGWQCLDNPLHGAFFQSGIEDLQRHHEWARRGIGNGQERFACPACTSSGLPGYMRPASATEIHQLEITAAQAA